jgi:methionyl aminopeptidase
MIYLRTDNEISKIKESAQLVSLTLAEVAKHIQPGVSTGKLDLVAEEFIKKKNAIPAFKGYGDKRNPFPSTLCVSVNDELVHGIPGARVLQEGDIVSIDCGVNKNGYYGDHAYTFPVGECEPSVLHLLATTLESLYKGIENAVHGKTVGDISSAIQEHCEAQGFGVVRDLVGHGLGTSLHEEPSIPNFGKAGKGPRLRSGMVLAIEPMINMGSWRVKTNPDGWTVASADGSMTAHFEHNVAVREDEAEILSTFQYITEITKIELEKLAIHG